MKTILIALTLTATPAGAATVADAPETAEVAVQDTINYDDYDEEAAMNDNTGKSRKNTAQGFNAVKYILDKRFRNYGEEFTKKWDDHLFIEVGAGMHQEAAKYDGTNLSMMGTASIGVGKQFNKLHTARLTLGGAFGYRRDLETNYQRVTAQADWIFDMSAYLDGYNPERLLDLSTVFGVGVRRVVSGATEKPTTADIHAGLQFRFFTGPQGYLAVTPYGGMSSTSISKKFHAFYGANLSYIYYIHNNLAPMQRAKYMRERPLWADSTVESGMWRTPWFVEAQGGVANISEGVGLGHSVGVNVGKWLSPAIALRVGTQLTTTTYSQTEVVYKVGTAVQAPASFMYNHSNHNLDLRLDALFNPLGFKKRFDWDATLGGYLVFGGGISWLAKNNGTRTDQGYWNDDGVLRTAATFYSAGVHLWYKLADGLQLYVEPRYAYYAYRIPYQNVSWAKRYSDTELQVNVGLTSTYREKRFRRVQDEYERRRLPITVGVGGGFSLTHTLNHYDGAGSHFNFGGHVEWAFNKLSSVRGAFEYGSMSGLSRIPVTYFDGLDEWPIDDNTNGGSGMFKHNYSVGLASLSYMANLSTLFNGYQRHRRFELEAFVGPAYLFLMSCKHEFQLQHTAIVSATEDYKESMRSTIALNGGLKLRFNATPHIAVTLTPQVYYLGKALDWQGVEMERLRLVETLDLGVQYSF